MKKYLISGLLIATLVSTACSKKDAQGPVSAAQKSAVKTLTALLPEDTQVVVTFGSFESIYTDLSVTESSILGFPVDASAINAAVGLNLLNLEALKTAGIDPQKPVAMAMTDLALDETADTARFTGLLLLPATDAKKVIAAITTAFEQDGAGFTVAHDGKFTVVSRAASQTNLYLAVKDDYVLIGGNPDQGAGPPYRNAKTVLTEILSEESELAKSTAYHSVTDAISAHDGVFVYMNLAALMVENSTALTRMFQADSGLSGVPAIGAGMAYLEDFQAFGASVDSKSADFTLRTLLTFTANARSKKLWEDLRVDKSAVLGIAEAPVVLASWAVNVAEYYRQLSDIAPGNVGAPPGNPLEGPLGTFEAMSGLDVEEDIIKNLGGNANLGIYDGSTISMANYNTLLALTVNDEAAMQHVLDQAIKAMPARQRAMITTQTVDGVSAYVALAGLTQIFLGIHNQQLILATSRPMFQKALAGKIENGFTSNLKPKELAETLKNTGNLIYVNIDEVVRAVRNFEIFLQGLVGGPKAMQDIYTTAGKFEYVLASSRLNGNAVMTDVHIKTRLAGPFLIELAKLIRNDPQP